MLLNGTIAAGGGTGVLSPSAFLGFIAGIILVGFVADVIFRRLSIPPTLFLILLGFVLSNVLHVVSPDSVLKIAPYFGTMAFAIILFEGGLALDIKVLVKKLTIAFLYSMVLMVVSTVAITALWVFYGGELSIGLLIGFMLGGTSGAIVLPLISKLHVSPEAKIISKFEAVLAEIYIVVGASVVLNMLQGKGGNPLQYMFDSVVYAVLIAMAVGFMWLQVIKTLVQNEIYYILTLGMLFGVYWVVELLGGSGPLAAIILGMVISNAHNIVDMIKPVLRVKEDRLEMLNFTLDEFTRKVSVELSFVFSTFFFLILGMTVNLRYLLDVHIIQGMFAVFLILVAVRLVVTFLLYRVDRDLNMRDGLILLFMMPRGLVSAIVAFTVGMYIPDKSHMFLSYAFGVILLTVVWMTAGTFFTKIFLTEPKEEKVESRGFWGLFKGRRR